MGVSMARRPASPAEASTFATLQSRGPAARTCSANFWAAACAAAMSGLTGATGLGAVGAPPATVGTTFRMPLAISVTCAGDTHGCGCDSVCETTTNAELDKRRSAVQWAGTEAVRAAHAFALWTAQGALWARHKRTCNILNVHAHSTWHIEQQRQRQHTHRRLVGHLGGERLRLLDLRPHLQAGRHHTCHLRGLSHVCHGIAHQCVGRFRMLISSQDSMRAGNGPQAAKGNAVARCALCKVFSPRVAAWQGARLRPPQPPSPQPSWAPPGRSKRNCIEKHEI